MAKIRILAVEDDTIYGETIRMTVEEAGYEMVDVLESGQDALLVIKSTKPDLVLMDINIPGPLNGIELAEKLGSTVPIIFLTSLREKEVFDKAKEVQPFAYMLKPFDPLMLKNTMELAIARVAGEKKDVWSERDIILKDSLFIKDKQVLMKVLISEISHIEADDKYCVIHTQDKRFTIRIALKDLLQKLPPTFIRVHRSFVIDYTRISKIEIKDFLVYIDETAVPIGVSYMDPLVSQLKKI